VKLEKIKYVSVDEYLENERKANKRHEYFDGAIYAMVGASTIHNLLALSLSSKFHTHLHETRCHVFQSDMKVKVEHGFYYPDILVVCKKLDPKAYYQTDPALIVEILSESTEAKDRLEKRVAYQHLDSMEEYVLVSQNKMKVEIFRRDNDSWQKETHTNDDIVNLSSIDLKMPIMEVYADVKKYM